MNRTAAATEAQPFDAWVYIDHHTGRDSDGVATPCAVASCDDYATHTVHVIPGWSRLLWGGLRTAPMCADHAGEAAVQISDEMGGVLK